MPAHPSEREISDSEGDASKVETQKRKHSIYSHFPWDRNCDICLRTRITRVGRGNEGSIPRAARFGDLIKADYKVLSEGCDSRNNHRYAVVVQDLATQWIQSYPCKTKTSQETQRSMQKFLEPTRQPKVIYTDNSLAFGKSCEDPAWNHRTSTPHRSETNGTAERAVSRVNEGNISCIIAIRLGWKTVGGFYGMLLLSAKCPRPPGRRENSVWEKIWRIFQRTNYSISALVEYLPNSERDKARIYQFGKKVLPGIFPGFALIAAGIWKGDILIVDIEELEMLDASEIHPRRLDAKEVLITHKDGESVFPVADSWATLSGRDYEFQEPTLGREHTVKRENLSGESQGDREEFHPEETKDDAETQKDFWSIQGDFIYRPHIEPRVQLYVPKEESFPIPLKNIDVIRSTHTDLDVAQEKRIDDYWHVDGNRNLSDSWTGFTRFTLLNKTPPKGKMWSNKNPNDITPRSHMAWRLDKNWKSRSKKRKTRMGNRETETRTRQGIEIILFYWPEWRRIQRHH